MQKSVERKFSRDLPEEGDLQKNYFTAPQYSGNITIMTIVGKNEEGGRT